MHAVITSFRDYCAASADYSCRVARVSDTFKVAGAKQQRRGERSCGSGDGDGGGGGGDVGSGNDDYTYAVCTAS